MCVDLYQEQQHKKPQNKQQQNPTDNTKTRPDCIFNNPLFIY